MTDALFQITPASSRLVVTGVRFVPRAPPAESSLRRSFLWTVNVIGMAGEKKERTEIRHENAQRNGWSVHWGEKTRNRSHSSRTDGFARCIFAFHRLRWPGPMDEPPPEVHSFVVKIWAKEVKDPRSDASWRGSVTHVGTGERRYIQRLMQIPYFIAPYVNEIGDALDLRSRLCLWITQNWSDADVEQ